MALASADAFVDVLAGLQNGSDGERSVVWQCCEFRVDVSVCVSFAEPVIEMILVRVFVNMLRLDL